MSRRKRSLGSSLIEMMVTLGVMSIVMIGIFRVFQEGMQLFRTNQQAVDAQQAAVKVLALITAEVSNATPEVAKPYDTLSGQPPGIVFATSLDENGKAYFHPTTGEIYWQRYLCFYFEPDSKPGGFNGKIFRAQMPVPNENSPPPPPGSRENSFSGNIVSSFVDANPTSFFQSATQKRMLANGISGFNMELYDGTEGNHVDTGNTRSVSFDITIEAGSPEAMKIRDSYYIKVHSRVTPRG